MPQIDICVATYKRPHLLATLLNSLVVQKTAGRFTFRIIVIDNDARRSAQAVVRSMANPAVEIVYDVEPEQGISQARNRGFAHATGEYIATIDDDEYADAQWLACLLDALTRYEADVVFGPAIPVFPPDTPEFIKHCGTFTLPDPPSGSTDEYVYHTANAFLRRAVVENMPAPFDPSLGLIGGEDTAFFDGLRRRQCKLVWCREARVFAPISRERATLRWIAKRDFRYGNACHWARQPGPFGAGLSRREELVRASKEIVRLSCSSSWYLLATLIDAKHLIGAAKRIRRLAYMLGLCAYHFRYRYEAYRRA
ncbi:MAG TPA: glycosyltransferase family 2 protein [Candidatus Kryptonia bacterium]|nr:glycosyltransferase family 2 protein [Candidatus Kryptonia bacterium]